jgi:coenzyme PQQ precursor peptide PqqA
MRDREMSPMAWNKPVAVEVCVGMEINMYFASEA